MCICIHVQCVYCVCVCVLTSLLQGFDGGSGEADHEQDQQHAAEQSRHHFVGLQPSLYICKDWKHTHTHAPIYVLFW